MSHTTYTENEIYASFELISRQMNGCNHNCDPRFYDIKNRTSILFGRAVRFCYIVFSLLAKGHLFPNAEEKNATIFWKKRISSSQKESLPPGAESSLTAPSAVTITVSAVWGRL